MKWKRFLPPTYNAMFAPSALKRILVLSLLVLRGLIEALRKLFINHEDFSLLVTKEFRQRAFIDDRASWKRERKEKTPSSPPLYG